MSKELEIWSEKTRQVLTTLDGLDMIVETGCATGFHNQFCFQMASY
jgi:hypothetical protein